MNDQNNIKRNLNKRITKTSIKANSENDLTISEKSVANKSILNESSGAADTGLVTATISRSKYLIFLQIASRLLTFLLNQLIVRFTTAKAFGIVAVQLDFLQSTILFLCREGFRCALLRSSNAIKNRNSSIDETDPKDCDKAFSEKLEKVLPKDAVRNKFESQIVINLGIIPFFFGIPFSIVSGFLFYNSLKASSNYSDSALSPEKETENKILLISISFYCFGALIELLSEPLFALAQNNLLFHIRALAEISGGILRCATTFVLIWKRHFFLNFLLSKYILNTFGLSFIITCDNDSWAVLSFSISQVIFSSVLISVYLGFLLNNKLVNSKFFIPRSILEYE
ncbi:Protein RFT1-like protein [Smittium culicis]|uniref:Man(5)GlcNAc(2)-PP-dolichol translocation protein RFT1 n=1 Tax=Smittium culicis TaxID=133412 RepID=A0A1R1XXG8_9FUNG|nr:Protein RFT1-like protein [Smittium culicis]